MTIKTKQHGFTLLEIMLVVAIMGVLLSLAIYKLKGNVEVAKRVAVQGDLQNIRTQLKLYESMNGFLPTSEQGLHALVAQPSTEPVPNRWTQFFEAVPKDPWAKEYIFLNPGRKNPSGFDLYSAGPDRKPDTADDDWGG